MDPGGRVASHLNSDGILRHNNGEVEYGFFKEMDMPPLVMALIVGAVVAGVATPVKDAVVLAYMNRKMKKELRK